ncbi:MAG TPA: 4a-hydroxytetrahydrobiopterin dehydratase [Leptospiraceae bacterium]|nr:4a-hydroxytetrahydrobiopterin dehydratase [Leptospiraceae bacterium]HMY66822.1 4a-hydroxytetrahydrobiopterin dehydratase [Leptospiraceae bacterium]HMZ61398.1 4a-hydroxytetrahydrobiopterin dehydratase [Leptospiraceae bacterium]HNF25360.1 4a-hydroxytetrahydrobiopterin dehydratase [Leptospiraceae bacterium]HNH09024.1 4a-hydroxytetrahydrobiopterin dehydratase [Leptospiraceae bacterium]
MSSVDEFLKKHPSWQIREGKLISEFVFSEYRKAVSFFIRLSELAERKNHHPEVTVGFRKVTVILHTFDVNEITEKDIESAEETEKIYHTLRFPNSGKEM